MQARNPDNPDRQAQIVRALVAALGALLAGVGWLRWATHF